MKKRAPVNRNKSRKLFTATAIKTKPINIVPKPMRGGIRL